MTQEDKELLIKDLCGRVPYGVKCQCFDKDTTASLTGVKSNIELYFDELDFKEFDGIANINYDYCKPYLFPMSSITEEQIKELKDVINKEVEIIVEQLDTHDYGIDNGKYHFNALLQLDWLNKNHFDYRGLIEKGLAIDATGKNIY